MKLIAYINTNVAFAINEVVSIIYELTDIYRKYFKNGYRK